MSSKERHGLISAVDLALLLATAKVALKSYASSISGNEEFDGTCVIDLPRWQRERGHEGVLSDITHVSRIEGGPVITWHPKTAFTPSHFTVEAE